MGQIDLYSSPNYIKGLYALKNEVVSKMKSVTLKRVLTLPLLLISLILIGVSSSLAAAPSIIVGVTKGSIGTDIDIPVDFSTDSNNVASIEFDLLTPPGVAFSQITGPSVTAAGKTLLSSTIPGGFRFVVSGNTNIIGSGNLLTARFRFHPLAENNKLYPIGITRVTFYGQSNQLIPGVSFPGAITLGNPGLTVSGVATFNGAPLSGVQIFAGPLLGTKTTDSSGFYSFTNVTANSFVTLQPSLSGYRFSPENFSELVSSNRTINFAASLNPVTRFDLTGQILSNNAGLAGVTVDGGSLGTRQTNSFGQFSFLSIPQGTAYTLRPSLNGFSFNPSPISGSLNGNTSVVMFGSQNPPTTFSVSGFVTSTNGSPLAGVIVNGGQFGSQVTNASGAYSFTGLSQGAMYTLIPVLSGYTFSPPFFSSNVSGNSQANFQGTFVSPPTGSFTISGLISVNGMGIAGVTVNTGPSRQYGAVTDSTGRYVLSVPTSGSYVVSPVLAGLFFTPATSSFVTVTNANVVAVNFSGSCSSGKRFVNGSCVVPTYSITGRVLLGDSGVAGARIRVGSLSTFSDASGNYRVEGVKPGRRVVRVTLTGYRFTPLSGTATVWLSPSSNSSTNLNFVSSCAYRYRIISGRCQR